MALEFIHDTPNAIVLLIFILVFLSLALIGLFIFTIFTEDGFNKRFDDSNTGTYIGVVATAMSIIIAFIITDEYQTYNTTSFNLASEANAIYTLVEILSAFDEVQANPIIETTIKYLCSIINIEFPIMEDGKAPPENQCLINLQTEVLGLKPTSSKDIVLYDKAIDQLNLAINLRNFRIEQSVLGLPSEFVWLLIIGVTILIVLTWFIRGNIVYCILMTSFITIIYSTLLFLVSILTNIFTGDFGLSDENNNVL